MLRWLPFLLVFASLGLFFDLGRMDIYSDHEGQRSVPPREMLESGNFIVPTINGETYLAKPPLLYWCVAAVYSLSGEVSPGTARFPTALSGFLIVLIVFLAFRRSAGDEAAGWAATITLTSFLFLERSRWAMIDTPFALAVLVTILLLLAAWRAQTTRAALGWALAAGVALGASNLFKGPVPYLFVWAAWGAMAALAAPDAGKVVRTGVSLAAAAFGLKVALWIIEQLSGWEPSFPFPLALILLGWTALVIWMGGERRNHLLWTTGVAVLLGTLLVVPWAVAVVQAVGWDYITSLINEQVAERTYTASEINSGSPFFYLYMIPLSCLPWGFLFLTFPSRHRWHERPETYRWAVLVVLLSILVFSLIAGKERHYLMPLVPFLALAAGFEVARINTLLREGVTSISDRLFTIFASAMAGLPGLGIAGYLLATGGSGYAIAVAAAFGIVAVALVIFAQINRQQQLRYLAVALLLASMSVISARSDYWQRENSFRQVAGTAGDLLRAGYPVGASRMYPGMAFHAGVIIPTTFEGDTLRNALAGDAPFYYLTEDIFIPVIQQLAPGQPLEVLIGPHTAKRVVLLGTRPLPDGIGPEHIYPPRNGNP